MLCCSLVLLLECFLYVTPGIYILALLFGFQILGRMKNRSVLWGKKSWKGARGKTDRFPCSFRAFYSIFVVDKPLSWCFGHQPFMAQWSAVEMGEAFWQQLCLTFPLWPHFSWLVFFFLLLFCIKRENTWPDSTCILTSSYLAQHWKM